MADSPKSDSAPNQDASEDTPKTLAPKDRSCQYCHQPFTSSSLGRHLDQFLFKKKPDGIHDVDEIRQQRGGITRRSAKRASLAKQEMEGSHSMHGNNASPAGYPSRGADALTNVNATPDSATRHHVNALPWQTMGMTNGQSASSIASPATGLGEGKVGKRKYSSIETTAAKDILSLRGEPGSDKETTRALELALREVLDTVRAAR